MKKIIILFLVLIPVLASAQTKKLLQEVKLNDGKTILVYSDRTWEYKASAQKAGPNSTSNTTSGTNTTSKVSSGSTSSKSYSSTCGARTKKGGSCQRKVSGGGRCWQHK